MPLNKQAIREEFRKLNHCGSLQVIEDFFISIIEKNEKENEEKINKLFSVYPSGNIHDFDKDEELISKKQVLQIIKNNKD